MSVNGSGKDRNGKPLNDTTTWTVKHIDGTVATDSKHKELTGVTAAVAFAAVRQARTGRGIHLSAVRT